MESRVFTNSSFSGVGMSSMWSGAPERMRSTIASLIASSLCPRARVPAPFRKSMYLLPSTSSTHEPLADPTAMGNLRG